MSSVIDALKRLERAGSEDSRSTAKLRDAADVLGRHVAMSLPDDATGLPRGYELGGGADAPFLTHKLRDEEKHPGEYQVIWYGDGPRRISRDAALMLAADVARGWLDELATWLETRTAESEQAAATLVAAKERLS